MRKLIPAAAVLTAAAACGSLTHQPPTTTAAATGLNIRQHVTYSIRLIPGECAARDNGHLPDPLCTPGNTDPRITQANIHTTICAKGWTTRIRPPATETSHAKHQIAEPAYNIPTTTTAELDHLIPLELGGNSDITNLWPETGTIPNPKDATENRLHHQVCAGTLTLAAAQHAIASNWQTVP